MDEILIGEKKYVSSKLAAKATGYAKDYIGQLCREGRVPARLVGRSWYVLESAIQDHRFGKPSEEAPHSTWESPHYEASDAEVFPSVNQLRDEEPIEQPSNDIEVAQRLQATWAAWFDRFDTPVVQQLAAIEDVVPEKPNNEPIETIIEIEPEVNIPIRTIYQPQQTIQEEIKPDKVGIQLPSGEKEVRIGGGRIIRAMQMFGVVFAMAIATIAVIGSGYLDSYILSSSPVSQIAGVAIYNK